MVGLARSLSGSSLRTQGPITPGFKSKERPLLRCRNESPRRRDERNCAHAGVPAFAGTTHGNVTHNPYAIVLRISGTEPPHVVYGISKHMQKKRPRPPPGELTEAAMEHIIT